MTQHRILIVLLLVFLLCVNAQAQEAGQRGGGDPSATRVEDVLALLKLLGAGQQPANTPAGQRGGGLGGRGTPNAATEANPDLLNDVRRARNSVNNTLSNSGRLLVSPSSGAWWTNTALMARLGVTDDQRLRIERVFENHRQNLTSTRSTLEKEEAELARLLDAEPLDRGSATTQIYKVVQARGEMERVNALMTLEMREVLTRAQWTQLKVQQSVNVSVEGTGGFGTGGVPGQGGGGQRGPRGQR